MKTASEQISLLKILCEQKSHTRTSAHAEFLVLQQSEISECQPLLDIVRPRLSITNENWYCVSCVHRIQTAMYKYIIVIHINHVHYV